MPIGRKRGDRAVAQAEARIQALIDAEAVEREAELQQALTLARAESAALLAEAERRISDERRAELVERERRVLQEFSGRLIEAQKGFEAKLGAWSQDLERARETLETHLARLEQRQAQLIADSESRFARESDRLAADTEEHRAALIRVRTETDRAIRDAVDTARNELELHGAERRRALHEVAERLRKRERELAEQIEREGAEAARRLTEQFADVERRQVEQLERSLSRETSRFAEAAAAQFDGAIKIAREEAARRLARELERSVQTFAHQAERVLSEQLAKVGDRSQQALHSRVQQLTARVSELEAALRRQTVASNFPGEGSS